MRSDEIKRILKKYKHIFDALEDYDRTGKLPVQRKRIDITLSVSAINKLKRSWKKQASQSRK